MLKTLKDLLDDGIKLSMEAQFTALYNIFTQQIEDIMNWRRTIFFNITAEAMNGIIDHIREDNTRLRTQVTDLTREVQSVIIAKATPAWSSPITATSLPLISHLEGAALAVDRQTLRQLTVGRPTTQPLRTPVVLRPTPTYSRTLTNSQRLARSSIPTLAASGGSKLLVQQRQTFN